MLIFENISSAFLLSIFEVSNPVFIANELIVRFEKIIKHITDIMTNLNFKFTTPQLKRQGTVSVKVKSNSEEVISRYVVINYMLITQPFRRIR